MLKYFSSRVVSSIYLKNIKVGGNSLAGEADIQDYAPAQNVIAGFFCTLFIIITVRRAFAQTGLVHQPLFRYVSGLFVGSYGVYKASMLCSDA